MTALSIIATVAMAFTSLFSNDRERVIEYNNLPQNAKTFVEKHFKNVPVSYVMEDKELTGTTYQLRFENGDEIEFKGNGEWEEIECKTGGIPESAIPSGIGKYVEKKHNGNKIVKIKKERNTYEVEINNDLELVFNSKEEILRYDD